MAVLLVRVLLLPETQMWRKLFGVKYSGLTGLFQIFFQAFTQQAIASATMSDSGGVSQWLPWLVG